jgi:hypothetical protein
MSNIFKKDPIRINEPEFNALPDYSIYPPLSPKIGERWKKNVHPKHTIVDRTRIGAAMKYEWWIAEAVKPADPVNENCDIVWARAEIIPLNQTVIEEI